MENRDKEIKCHTDSPMDCPTDGILMKTDCIRTDFIANPEKDGVVFQQRDKSKASISASVEMGTFSIRDRTSEVMLTISFEDAMEVVATAVQASKEANTWEEKTSDNVDTVEEE